MTGCLLIPVEVKARELQAKVYLSLMAAARGWKVILAHSVILQQIAPLLPPSVYLEKNIFPAREGLFRDLRKLGHDIVAWDEEAIAVFNYDWYVAKNVQPHMLELVSKFLTWGERDREEIARRHPAQSARLIAAGNPRADLLRPEHRGLLAEESHPYRERYGDYLLVLSNFSRVNTYGEGIEDYVANVTRTARLDAATSAYFLGALRHMQALFDSFLEMLAPLSAAFPERRIIVRPHPAEIMATWAERTSGLPNVEVVREGTAVGWIDGAAALIHNGCTTGIEAFLMGRLPIAYQPIVSAEFDIALPNALSLNAFDTATLIEMARQEIARSPRADLQRAAYRNRIPVVKPIVCSIDGPLAADRILDTLASPALRPARQDIDVDLIRRQVSRKDAEATAVAMVKEPLRRLKSVVTGSDYVPASLYARQKYEGTSLAEIQSAKRRHAQLNSAFERIAVKELVHDCFMFEANA